MRLLIVNNGIWRSGAQISINEFLALITDKLEVKVLTCTRGRNLARISGVEVYRLPCRNVGSLLVMYSDRVAESLFKWADIVWIATSEFTVAPEVKHAKEVPVVVHLHSYELICPFMWLCYGLKKPCNDNCSLLKSIDCMLETTSEKIKKRISSVNYSLTSLIFRMLKMPLYYAEWRKLISKSLHFIDSFIAVSKATRDIHVRHLPEFKSKPSIVVYNPVTEPLKYIRPNPGEPYGNYLLYASGPNPVKGPHLLLEAWSVASREFRDLRLYMVACKNSWVESIAKKMNLKNIIFTEKLPLETCYQLMYRAKAVVMPSICPESFGRIPVEANRLGVPAVVSDGGALPEIVENNITGIISKARSEDLVNAIVKVIAQEWDRGKIIESSLKRVNPNKATNSLLKFFEDLLR